MTDLQLNIKARDYLIRNSYMILAKIHDDVNLNLRDVLIDVYEDAYRAGSEANGKQTITELEERITELEKEVVKTDILKVENL